jgi:hypothetical protein
MFTGVKRAYVLLILYIMRVIERYGTDTALELLEEASERQGSIIADKMKHELQEEKNPLKIGAEVYSRFLKEAGAEIVEYKHDEKSFTFIVKKCPFYEALLDVGVDCGVFLNGLCSNLTLPSIQNCLKSFNLNLKVETVLTRESAEEICLERIFLKE